LHEDSVCTLGWLENMVKGIDKGSFKTSDKDNKDVPACRFENLLSYYENQLLVGHNNDEINEILDKLHTSIHYIRENFRNRAAHPYLLSLEDTYNCMGILLDREKLIKEIVTTFTN